MNNFGDFCEKALRLRNKYVDKWEALPVSQEKHEKEKELFLMHCYYAKMDIVLQIVTKSFEAGGELPSYIAFMYEDDGYITDGYKLSLVVQEVLTDLEIIFKFDGCFWSSKTHYAGFHLQP